MTKYVYLKLVGLILVILGFSYSLTSFSNFFAYLYGDIEIANANIYLMSIGLVFPLYMFIFGIYFYFYSDREFAYINPFILTSGIGILVLGLLRLFINISIMTFIHISFAYVLIVCGVLLIYGCIRYKYWGAYGKEKNNNNY